MQSIEDLKRQILELEKINSELKTILSNEILELQKTIHQLKVDIITIIENTRNT